MEIKITGKIIKVDLSSGTVLEEPTQNYTPLLGGRALGSWLVSKPFDDLKKPDPKDQPIAIAAGALTGTNIPLATRTTIVGRNLISGGFFYSNVGGNFGFQMRRAGYDAILIQGASPSPVCLLLKDGTASLIPAGDLWGLKLSDLQREVHKRYGQQSSHLAIGPAGEALVKISCLLADRAHAAGWGGSGAIFGAKKLKAVIAVGSKLVPVADPATFALQVEAYKEKVSSSFAMNEMKTGGTHRTAGAGGVSGLVPTAVRNINDEFMAPEVSLPIREESIKHLEVGRAGCKGCQVNCLHVYHVETEDQGQLEIEGMHANSVRGFGSNLEVLDARSVLLMHYYSNEYGMDVDGVSSSLAFALECAEHGLLEKDQPGGIHLEWGDGASLVKLTEQIAKREHLGNLLAEGVYRVAQVIGDGSEQYAMMTKRIGINEQGIRSHRGWALGIITSTRGGGHLGGSIQTENRRLSPEDGLRLTGNAKAGVPSSYEGKGKLVAESDIRKVVVDSLGLCYFAYGWYDLSIANLEDLAGMYTSVTGDRKTGEDLRKLGLYIHSLERSLMHQLGGFDRKDDTVPNRFFDNPISSGPVAGEKLDRKEVQKALDEYYETLGWDIASGLPTPDLLEDLLPIPVEQDATSRI
jgi:aldehyde:ferredoxin oxidoreductase